jgi:hypothetical protein
MSQPRESGSHKRREKEHRRHPEQSGGGGRMTEDRPKKNPSRKDRSRTSPANEFQVWNGDVDDESDAGTGRDIPSSRGPDEEDEK